MFRTADGAGVSHIVLTGYTPVPTEAKGRAAKEMKKVALGAETMVPWTHVDSALEVLSDLKRDGYTILALEKNETAIDIFSYTPPQKFALFVGNEVDGVSQEILDLCDATLMIPMRGQKESLNVSVATGIALYTLLARA